MCIFSLVLIVSAKASFTGGLVHTDKNGAKYIGVEIMDINCDSGWRKGAPLTSQLCEGKVLQVTLACPDFRAS